MIIKNLKLHQSVRQSISEPIGFIYIYIYAIFTYKFTIKKIHPFMYLKDAGPVQSSPIGSVMGSFHLAKCLQGSQRCHKLSKSSQA